MSSPRTVSSALEQVVDGAGCPLTVQHMAEFDVKDMEDRVGIWSTGTEKLLTSNEQQFADCVTVDSACHNGLVDVECCVCRGEHFSSGLIPLVTASSLTMGLRSP